MFSYLTTGSRNEQPNKENKSKANQTKSNVIAPKLLYQIILFKACGGNHDGKADISVKGRSPQKMSNENERLVNQAKQVCGANKLVIDLGLCVQFEQCQNKFNCEGSAKSKIFFYSSHFFTTTK